MNHILMENITIRGKEIKNRVVLPPMSLLGAGSHAEATEKMEKGYESFAKGGFGLIITEGLYIDEKYSQGAPKQPGLVSEEQKNSWKPIVQKVHEHGAVMIAQIAHIGALGRGNLYTDKTVAPSAISLSDKMPIPKELTDEEIKEIVKAFGITAKCAEETGFDGVEIHAAMGLIQQFLNPMTNRREDNYGGSIENRMAVLVEVIKEIRRTTSATFLLGVRVLEDASFTLEETEQFFRMLGIEDIDYVHTSEIDALNKTTVSPEKVFSALAKEYSGKIVIAAGGLGDPAKACEARKTADMISVGKMALANPDWVEKVNQNLPLNIPQM